jgi:ribosomal protein L16 Arg81 hydroxylase
MNFSFERLVAPIDRATFFSEYWEKKPLIVRRENRAWWKDLITVDDVNECLTTRNIHHPKVNMINASRKMGPDEFTYPSGLIDTARMYKLFSEGSTITLNGFETEHPALAALCRAMEHELSIRFQTNLYYTPARAQGFRTHYDSHDVFAIQVHGSKKWTLYNTPIALPYRRQEFVPDEHPVGEVSMEFVLHEGDMAYIPRGIMHDARTTGEDSLHVTLGVLFSSYTDLLAEAMGITGLRDVNFRKSLPVGFALPGFDRSAVATECKNLVRQFLDSADFEDALEHFIDDLIDTRHALLPGQAAAMRSCATITDGSTIKQRPSVLYRLREEANNVVLQVYGNHVTFPAVALKALRFAMEHNTVTVSALPDLDEEGRLTLARRLIREGVFVAE